MDMKQETQYYLGLVDEYEAPTGYDCYVWAGEFCVNGIEWCVRNEKKFEVFQEDALTYDDIHSIYCYLKRVKDKTINHLKNVLNEYHRTDYSEFKWKILLNAWLMQFLPSVYDKYLKLRKIRNEDRLFHVDLYEAECVGVPLDKMDIHDLFRNDLGFHKYAYSILFKYMPDIPNIIVDRINHYKRKPVIIKNVELPEHVKSFVDEYRKYKEATNIQDEIVIQSPFIKFTLYKEIMEKKYGRISGYFNYTDFRNDMNLDRDLDVEWRTSERHIAEEDEFVRLIYKMIGYFIPIAYVEEFSSLRDMAIANYKWGSEPKVLLYDAHGVVENELFKIYMMNVDIEHVLKVGIMHTTQYGVGGDLWRNWEVIGLCDEFLDSTGIANDKLKTRFIRMPYINFFRRPEQKGDIEDTIIYAHYSMPQHPDFLSVFEWDWKRYMDGELKFLKLLDKDVIAELKFRLHPCEITTWKNKEKVMETVPELIFDEVTSFYESICHAKLVIAEMLSTAAMDAMSVDKPTIILYSPIGFYVELNDAYKDIEDLIRVGVIAETPEKLAALVNRIHNDVESWWNEPERQRVMKKFREKFLYFPENAKEIWINKIVSYLDE